MNAISNTPPLCYNHYDAIKNCEQLKSFDDEWDYRPIKKGNIFLIGVFDEEDEILGYM